MNEATSPSELAHTRFSIGWCIIFAFFHFVFTWFIAGIYISVGMGVSTRNANDFHFPFALSKSILWIWSPLAMAFRSPDHTPNEDLLVGLAILWSCVVGIAAGFTFPFFRRRQYLRLYPAQPSNENTRNA